jgi:hypothetical protein
MQVDDLPNGTHTPGGTSGQEPVPESHGNVWLAYSVFYELQHLRDVLAELTTAGFEAGSFCIVHLPALQPWAELHSDDQDAGGEALAGIFGRLREQQGVLNEVAYLGGCPTLRAKLQEAPQTQTETSMCPSWMTRPQCIRLTEHLRQGSAALFVRSKSQEHQDTSNRILLRHSRHVVVAYDFSRSTA